MSSVHMKQVSQKTNMLNSWERAIATLSYLKPKLQFELCYAPELFKSTKEGV